MIDAPAPGQQLEAFCLVGTLDDLERPFADFGERPLPFLSGKSTIGKDTPQPGKAVADRRQHARRAVAVLDIGGVDISAGQKALRVGQDVALASLVLSATI